MEQDLIVEGNLILPTSLAEALAVDTIGVENIGGVIEIRGTAPTAPSSLTSPGRGGRGPGGPGGSADDAPR